MIKRYFLSKLRLLILNNISHKIKTEINNHLYVEFWHELNKDWIVSEVYISDARHTKKITIYFTYIICEIKKSY